ncbi:GNAT family N-acetyltransferase [Paenarthrobacter sp. Z7-10]|nr:GNAT family N-acetyltransferase [Paenarthrobacter sp. Z7-10]
MRPDPAVPGLRPEAVVPVLADGTVTLRALTELDTDQLVHNCRDPESVRWTKVPLDYAREDARSFIHDVVPQWWTDGSQQTFAVADAATDALLGTIGLHAFRPGAAEVGINIGPHARGRGVSERAARLLLDYSFDQLNLLYLHWRVLVPNWASRKLAWKLGFAFDAQVRGFADNRGTPADAWILTLARDDGRRPVAQWDGPERP